MNVVGEIISGVIVTGGMLFASDTVPQLTEKIADVQLTPWMEFVYRMTLAIVPVFVALIYTRRRKLTKEDKDKK